MVVSLREWGSRAPPPGHTPGLTNTEPTNPRVRVAAVKASKDVSIALYFAFVPQPRRSSVLMSVDIQGEESYILRETLVSLQGLRTFSEASRA